MTAAIFVAAFLVCSFFAVMRHPIYGLIAYVGVFYINPPARWWGQGVLLDVRWSYIAAAVTFLGVLIHRPGRSRVKVGRDPIVYVFCAFLVWIAAQEIWAIDLERQQMLLEYYAKFGIAVYLICRTLETERQFRLFVWAHLLGCFYFGWLAYTQHGGGRFEDFGGAGVRDANEAALTIGTGALVLGSLLLYERLLQRVVLIGIAPFLVNAIVATVSRSGFLSLAMGGALFNVLTPPKFRKWVLAMSALAVVLLLMLTTDSYWERIDTIKQRGQEVEGVDTGSGRLEVMKAQLRMFRDHPWGCGHFCTTVLSPSYVDVKELDPELGVRSSHNTFLSMLVEQGLPGAVVYVTLLAWVFVRGRRLARQSRGTGNFVSLMLPGVVGSLGAMFLADMFVPYVRYEVRFWFLALLVVLMRFQEEYRTGDTATPLSATTDNRHS